MNFQITRLKKEIENFHIFEMENFDVFFPVEDDFNLSCRYGVVDIHQNKYLEMYFVSLP